MEHRGGVEGGFKETPFTFYTWTNLDATGKGDSGCSSKECLH